MISTLLMNMYLQIPLYLDVAETGHVHSFISAYTRQLINTETLPLGHHAWELPNSYITPEICNLEELPLLFFIDDSTIDYASIISLRRNFKHLRILYTVEDCLRISTNHFYKMHRLQPGPLGGQLKMIYDSTPSIRRGISTAAEFSFTEFLELQKHPASEYSEAMWCLSRVNVAPAAFSNHIHDIMFYDIMYNKERVIKILEDCTQLKMSPAIRAFYDRYIQVQHDYFDPLISGELEYPK